MRLPLEVVLRRGVIFLWPQYDKLDDPTLAGQTKAKFIVILSGSPDDDPLLYILPVLKRMFERRIKGYRALGYSESD